MTISKSLAEAMGGALSGASSPGKGAVFTLDLDLPLAEADELADAETMPVAANDDPPLAPPMRILLAEDHPTNRKVVSLILGAMGAELTCVENGEEAAMAVERGDFDLVLMDLQMPVMDGLTAIRVIREWERKGRRAHTPILALTANAMAGDAEASARAGADGHLTKPIAAEKLVAAIQDMRRAPPSLAVPDDRATAVG